MMDTALLLLSIFYVDHIHTRVYVTLHASWRLLLAFLHSHEIEVVEVPHALLCCCLGLILLTPIQPCNDVRLSYGWIPWLVCRNSEIPQVLCTYTPCIIYVPTKNPHERKASCIMHRQNQEIRALQQEEEYTLLEYIWIIRIGRSMYYSYIIIGI